MKHAYTRRSNANRKAQANMHTYTPEQLVQTKHAIQQYIDHGHVSWLQIKYKEHPNNHCDSQGTAPHIGTGWLIFHIQSTSSKGQTRAGHASSVHKLKLLFTVSLSRVTLRCLRFGENEVERTRKVKKKKEKKGWQISGKRRREVWKAVSILTHWKHWRVLIW